MNIIKIRNNNGHIASYIDGVETDVATVKNATEIKKFFKTIMDKYPESNIEYYEVLRSVEGSLTARVKKKIKRTPNYFKNVIDTVTQNANTNPMDYEDIVRARPISGIILATSLATSITVGVLVGKTLLTGAAIALGTNIIVDLVIKQTKLRQRLINKTIK